MNNKPLLPKNAKQIFIDAPTGKLDCLELAPFSTIMTGIAIIFHPDPKGGGTNTNKIVQTMAKTLCLRGYLCICPNLRGVGLSDGIHDMGIGEVEDAKAVLNYLRDSYPSMPLILGGFSFGTSIASLLAKDIDYKKLILIGPAVSKYEVAVSDIKKTIAIHGDNDEVVAPALVEEWSRYNELPVIWFPNTGHFFHGKLIVLQNLLSSFDL